MDLKDQLTVIADELNTRQVVYPADGGIYTLEFDTISREATAFNFSKEETS